MPYDSSFSLPTSHVVGRLRYRAMHQGEDRAFSYLVDGETEQISLTYGELDRRSRAVAAKLLDMGLEGERALLLYPPGLDFVSAYFGCLYAGVVAVPAYPPRRNRNVGRIQTIAADCDAKIALTIGDTLERVTGLLDETPLLKSITWLPTDTLETQLADRWSQPNITDDTLAMLQYTSGSTGDPKGVMLTHANLMHNSALISFAFEATRSCSGVFWLPMYHDMGLIGGILQPMYIGQPNVLMSPMSFLQKPFRWLQAISRTRATISGGPNFAYDLCVKKITPEQRAKLDLSCWNLAFNGAEPIRAETIERFSETFAACGFRREAFYPCYGMAESTLIVTGGLKSEAPVIRTFDGEALDAGQAIDAAPNEAGARPLVGCGSKLPDSNVLIVEPQTRRRLPPGQVGEIWTSSPSVAVGYYNKPDATVTSFRAYLADTGEGPYLRTGDYGFIQDGELFVTGRLKDLIIVNGVNRYPTDIEKTVESLDERIAPNASAAVAVEVDGKQRLVIVAETTKTRERKYSDLIQAIRREVMAEHEVSVDAVALIRVGTIPKTSSGKIQRNACGEAFLAGELAVFGGWCAWDASLVSDRPRDAEPAVPAVDPQVAQIVLAHVQAAAGLRAAEVTLESNIVELGLESIARMEIIASLEETFGGRFPSEVLPRMMTCLQTAQAVEKYLGKTPVPQPTISVEADPLESLPEYAEYQQIVGAKATSYASGNGNGAPAKSPPVDFTSRDLLGLSRDPAVISAATAALQEYGHGQQGVALQRSAPPLDMFERTLADFLGTESALSLGASGSEAAQLIASLLPRGGLILIDEAYRAALPEADPSLAPIRTFAHGDVDDLERQLQQSQSSVERVLVLTEGVSLGTGGIAPLPNMLASTRRHGAMLAVDESVSLAAMGPHGRGLAEHFEIDSRTVDFWLGRLQSIGSPGSFVAGRQKAVTLIRYLAFKRSLSAMMAADAEAATAALRVIEDSPERLARLAENVKSFAQLASVRGVRSAATVQAPLIVLPCPDRGTATRWHHRLSARGVEVELVLDGGEKLRWMIRADHDRRDLETAAAALGQLASESRPSATPPLNLLAPHETQAPAASE